MSKLTQSANGMTCIKCGNHDAYACHYNGPLQHYFGKGMGKKCHDLASAEFCYHCDQQFYEGKLSGFLSQEHKDQEWFKWIMLTNIRREKRGDIKI